MTEDDPQDYVPDPRDVEDGLRLFEQTANAGSQMTETVSPDAREAAAWWLAAQGERFPSRAVEAINVAKGELDHHSLVQAFARFEAHLRSPATGEVGEMVAEMRSALDEYHEPMSMLNSHERGERLADRIDALTKGGAA